MRLLLVLLYSKYFEDVEKSPRLWGTTLKIYPRFRCACLPIHCCGENRPRKIVPGGGSVILCVLPHATERTRAATWYLVLVLIAVRAAVVSRTAVPWYVPGVYMLVYSYRYTTSAQMPKKVSGLPRKYGWSRNNTSLSVSSIFNKGCQGSDWSERAEKSMYGWIRNNTRLSVSAILNKGCQGSDPRGPIPIS